MIVTVGTDDGDGSTRSFFEILDSFAKHEKKLRTIYSSIQTESVFPDPCTLQRAAWAERDPTDMIS